METVASSAHARRGKYLYRLALANGSKRITSEEIGGPFEINSSMVRRDLHADDSGGRRGVGYEPARLLKALKVSQRVIVLGPGPIAEQLREDLGLLAAAGIERVDNLDHADVAAIDTSEPGRAAELAQLAFRMGVTTVVNFSDELIESPQGRRVVQASPLLTLTTAIA